MLRKSSFKKQTQVASITKKGSAKTIYKQTITAVSKHKHSLPIVPVYVAHLLAFSGAQLLFSKKESYVRYVTTGFCGNDFKR